MDELAIALRSDLAHLGRRLRLRDGWLLAQRSAWVASLGMVIVQLAGRVWPVQHLWLWTLVAGAAWPLAVAGAALLRPLPSVLVAHRLDGELGLKERLATALELGDRAETNGTNASQLHRPTSFSPSLVTLQRQDALVAARAIDPRRAMPLVWLGRSLVFAVVPAAVAMALALLPNPMQAVLAERAAVAQAAQEQADTIERLRDEIQGGRETSPETRQELMRRLDELSQQLRANRGDRAEALASLSKAEAVLSHRVDPDAGVRQATLAALAAQLQALAEHSGTAESDLSEVDEALEELAARLAETDTAGRESLAQALAQMASQAGLAGEADLAQALAALAQAAQQGESVAAAQAATAAAGALAQAQGDLTEQAVLREALAQLQASRQAIAQAGLGQSAAQAQGPGQGQGPPGGGGGTKADTLPPASGVGQASRPQGLGQAGAAGQLDQQIYVPWQRRQGNGDELFITGQETGQGQTQVRQQGDALPGSAGPALVPYRAVYYDYLDAANQTIERGYIPSGYKDYVREYFSRLEP